MSFCTYPMNVCSSRFGEIVVHHTVHAFKIHTPGNDIGCYQNPSLACSEVINSIFPLKEKERKKKEKPRFLLGKKRKLDVKIMVLI